MIVFDESRIGPWVCKRTGADYVQGTSTAIGLEKDGQLIAGVLYDNWNGRSVCMHVAAQPGSRWMTREYLRVCFDYPFNQLKVNQIIGLVDSTNQQARAFDEHIGFRVAAVIPDAGRSGDLMIYTMHRDQCRWIGATHGKSVHAACA